MVRLSRRAEQQVAELSRHYDRLGRPEARQSLLAALRQAAQEIEEAPSFGLPAPRPYPSLASPGRAGVKSGRYWVAYRTTDPPLIVAVFFDGADIPGRL